MTESQHLTKSKNKNTTFSIFVVTVESSDEATARQLMSDRLDGGPTGDYQISWEPVKGNVGSSINSYT